MDIFPFNENYFVYLKLFLLVEANPFNPFTGIHFVYLELFFLVEVVLLVESVQYIESLLF